MENTLIIQSQAINKFRTNNSRIFGQKRKNSQLHLGSKTKEKIGLKGAVGFVNVSNHFKTSSHIIKIRE